MIKAGLLDANWARFYDRLFEDRTESDYLPLAAFEDTYVGQQIAQARDFLNALRPLIRSLSETV